MATLEAQMAAAAQQRVDRDREIRDIKTMLHGIDAKLDTLNSEHLQQQGALKLGRWLVNIGIPSLIGGWALALWQLFGGKH